MAITEVTVCYGRNGVPGAEEVESLCFAAFGAAPLYESREAARESGQLYDGQLSRSDLVTVFTRKSQGGELAGLAYGYPWRWAEHVNEWSDQLRERLGGVAADLEGRFAVYLLAVDPNSQRQGLGRGLLRNLLEAAGTERAWLITRDEPTPAMTLYTAQGWKPAGHGPDTPNGRPGLVLIVG
jgi:ribosomal protein S18 acetylase RimI-like enzyme